MIEVASRFNLISWVTVLLLIVTNSDIIWKIIADIDANFAVAEGRAEGWGLRAEGCVTRSINLSKFSFSECDQSTVESRVTFICISHVGVRINLPTNSQSRTTCVIKIYFTIRNGKTQPGARTFPRAAPGSSRQVFLVYVNTKRTALFFLPPGRALQLKSSNCKSMKITRRWRGHHSIVLTQGNFWI